MSSINTIIGSEADSNTARTDLLRDFLVQRRWFRSKARQIQSARIRDSIAIPEADCTVILLDVEFAPGDVDTYLLTMADGDPNREALENPKFTNALLNVIANGASFPGQHGTLTACHTATFERIRGASDEQLAAKVSKAEQTNSSVFYGEQFILKLYRKLDAGVNPDFEIGALLTEKGFKHTPAVAGHIEYRAPDSKPMSVGILQQFVPNRGDAWEYTLEQAERFFQRALQHGPPPMPPTQHPLELIHVAPPGEAVNLIGAYLESARLLGERTAEMHIALASAGGDPEFEPEPFTGQFRNELHKRLLAQSDTAIGLIRDNQQKLKGEIADDARRLLELEPRIREVFRKICATSFKALRIRHHGDYHLGQVLYTNDDFMIIDFEGEPARPLSERRMKGAAMRDVAGMIRSFQYASYSALRKCEPRSETGLAWAAFWTGWVSQAFVARYFELARGHRFQPEDETERKLLFDVFVLEKALYEVAYEMNNRPDWVEIPLRGIAAGIE